MSTTVRRVSRRARRCDSCDATGVIWVGDAYLVHTDFPGSGLGYADQAGHPVRMAECVFCAARFGRDHLLEPLPASQMDRYTEGIYQRGLV